MMTNGAHSRAGFVRSSGTDRLDPDKIRDQGPGTHAAGMLMPADSED